MSTGTELLSLGNAFAERHEMEQAVACYRGALAAHPNWPEALCNLGNAFREMGRVDEAVPFLEQALRCRPNFPDALINLAVVLEEQGALKDAECRLRQVLHLRPEMAYAHNNLGSVLEKQGLTAEALVHLHEAIRLQPQFAEAYHNLGVALERLNRPEDAIVSYREALRLRPDYADAHLDLGLVLLSTGEFASGWEEYEWRWRTRRTVPRGFHQPEWDGSPLNGRTLLVHAEQGLGDTIQFLRYVAMIPDASIVLEVPRSLVPLAAGLPGAIRVIAAGSALPDFDLHVPLLSLPRIFHTTLDTIPSRTPYLVAGGSPASTRGLAGTFRVGLVWAGGAANSNNRTRSMRLAALAPLGAIPGVSFFSLQKGPEASELKPAGLPITDLLTDTSDIAGTAAAILNLDLIVSVDTMVAHLAGALGKPVWTLLSFASDWRWLRRREDCPWYPTMRLFRQNSPGDWKSVVEYAANQLHETSLCHLSKL